MSWISDLDVVLLSRWQFALTIMFHYLFPPLTIGMGVVLVYLEGMYLWTRESIYEQAARFWTRIFAVNFALGVATGIVMEFEFGTNWAMYSRFVGDVFGSALAAEGIFAFFLESGFLAVLVFGWDRVGPKFHFFATVMVALGSIFSSIWITVANSWQQTPAGHHIVPMMRDGQPWVVDGEVIRRAEIVDFWAMVFNPSTVHRLIHVWIGCFILGAAFIMSISAWYLLQRRHEEFARRSFTGALLLATVSSLAILVSGHRQAQNVAETQPAKMAAFEAHYRTGPADLSLFGIPDDERATIHGNVAVPGGLSLLIHGDRQAEVIGLDRFRPEDRPPVRLAFFSYRLMVGIGMFFLVLTLGASWLRWRNSLFTRRWLLWTFVAAVVPAFVANEAGWVAAEVGRQPWIVYAPLVADEDGDPTTDPQGRFQFDESRGLRTSAGISRAIEAEQVLGSIIMFGAIYALLFVLWVYVLHQKISHGPDPHDGSTGQETGGALAAAAERVAHSRSMTASD
ncbi:MAG TPA: cytochrome ubiquinol oxidase subunit I [Lacipirellulaceae bacterium]|nr:cytochrome ubiquinol oxidase subunit I [Lacipirellulaceae bacterium]